MPENSLLYIFLTPAVVVLLIYIVFRVNLNKVSQKPERRQPTQLKYNRLGIREVIFWPREEEMPSLRRFLRAGILHDPQLGPLIMIIYSRFEFWLLCMLNLIICILCADALLGGTLVMTAMAYNYLDLPKHQAVIIITFVFMFFWGFFNLYRTSNKILFYEHGLVVMPKRNNKYEYNDILEVDIFEKKLIFRKNIQCYISLKNSRALLFDGRQYAKLKAKIIFWQKNLMWTS